MVLRVWNVIIVELLLLGRCSGRLRHTVDVLWDHEDGFAVHDWIFITLIYISGRFTIVAIQDRFVHGQAWDRLRLGHLTWATIILILRNLRELSVVLLGRMTYLRKSNGLLDLLLFFAHLLCLCDLLLLSDRKVFTAHIEWPLWVHGHVDWKVHARHVLTRAEYAFVADTSHYFIRYFDARCRNAGYNVMLHPVQSLMQWVARLEVCTHEVPVRFFISIFDFSHQDGVVS